VCLSYVWICFMAGHRVSCSRVLSTRTYLVYTLYWFLKNLFVAQCSMPCLFLMFVGGDNNDNNSNKIAIAAWDNINNNKMFITKRRCHSVISPSQPSPISLLRLPPSSTLWSRRLNKVIEVRNTNAKCAYTVTKTP